MVILAETLGDSLEQAVFGFCTWFAEHKRTGGCSSGTGAVGLL